MRRPKPLEKRRILSFAFGSRRLGFVVTIGTEVLVDYGVKTIPRTDKEIALSKAQKLIDRYHPEFICIQDVEDPECMLGNSIYSILVELENMIVSQEIPSKAVSKSDVWNCLELPHGSCKQKVWVAVKTQFPQMNKFAFEQRKPWECEDPKVCILTATSFLQTLKKE